MASLETISIAYRGKDYSTAVIPDIFTSTHSSVLIGPHSLGIALYDDNIGYIDEEAREIDEQIYAFVDDELFTLSSEDFIARIKEYLD